MRGNFDQPYKLGNTIQDLEQLHPFPWREHRSIDGAVFMVDGANTEVNLFAITKLAELVTGYYARERNGAKQEEQSS